jgi:CheY-like chemotaxis protein
VRIYLPATAAVGERVPGQAEAEEAAASGSESVLIAEDDPFVRSFGVASLSSLGYRVIEAADGREALEKLNNGAKVDILFTDIVMPGGVNGWELAEQARRIRPGLKVLLTSGYALETLAERGRLPKGALILHKPYRKVELAKRLREALAVP